jgi:hypothetical protein
LLTTCRPYTIFKQTPTQAYILETIQEIHMSDPKTSAPNETSIRLEWVEPEIRELDVRETAFDPHSGADGEKTYPDCTRS